MPENLGAHLQQGVKELALETTSECCERLLAYIDLVDKWNRQINLTAVRAPADMVGRHILDALSVAPYVDQEKIIDIGSGAGVPGIPLAIFRPDQHWVLVDTSGKRISFLREVVRRLALNNVRVTKDRIQSFRVAEPYPAVIARAFASLGEIADNARHLLAPSGIVWAMKGRYPVAELAELPADFSLLEVIPLKVPGLDEDRHLVKLSFNPET